MWCIILDYVVRQVAFSSGGMLSAFKPVGDDQQEPSTQCNPQSTDSVLQSTTNSTSTLYYPMITNTANQPWEPTVLIKPQPPPPAEVTVVPPPKKKATVKPKKVKKKQVDHSGFVPRKIEKTLSTAKNPFLVTPPLPAEKKEEEKAPKEPDDLFSLYDDFDVAPAAATPIDTTPSGASIWDSFEATVVQQQQKPPEEESDVDSEESSDVSSVEAEEQSEVTTPIPDQVNTANNAPAANEEVKETSRSDLVEKTIQTHHLVEQKTESRNERLLRLLGMPMKSFLSAGHQCPLKDHTVLKESNTGSYLNNPRPSEHDVMTEETTPPTLQKKQPLINSSGDTASNSSSSSAAAATVRHDIKRPDGLSFGLSKRGQLRQRSEQLFDKEDSPVEDDAIFVGAKGIRDIKSTK